MDENIIINSTALRAINNLTKEVSDLKNLIKDNGRSERKIMYTRDEFCKEVGIGRSLLDKLEADNKIKVNKPTPRKHYIDASEVERFLRGEIN